MRNYNIIKVERNKITYKNGDTISITHKDYSYLMQELEKDILNHRNMIEENNILNYEVGDEINSLLERIVKQEDYIEMNQQDPFIRRGLANICFDLEENRNKVQCLWSEQKGIQRVIDRDMKRLEAMEKALKKLCNIIISDGFSQGLDFGNIERR